MHLFRFFFGRFGMAVVYWIAPLGGGGGVPMSSCSVTARALLSCLWRI